MGRGVLEREIKLEVGIGFRIPILDGVAPGISARADQEQHLQAVYMDTPDLRLARSGLTLRHRSERSPSSGAGEWTLKFPEAPWARGLSRREINQPGRWGPVPVELAGLVRAFRRTSGLVPVARLVTHRRRMVVCGRFNEPLLEIDDDVVSVMDGRRLGARFREVEVEVVGSASEALLDAVVERLGEAGAVAGDGRSKLVRAIGYRATEPPDVAPVRLRSSAPMGEAVRAAVAEGYLRLVAHDLGVRLGPDPESVHQARVATRRLRSDLRTFRGFLPDVWCADTRAELGWLADALGRARDADVLSERLGGQAALLAPRDAGAASDLLGRLGAEREGAREDLLATLDSDRYGDLLERLASAARELPPLKAAAETGEGATSPQETGGAGRVGPDGALDPAAPVPKGPNRAAPAADQAAAVVSKPRRHLARAVDGLGPEPTDDALHQVRIRAKRLRYACEAVTPVVGKPAAKLARAAADLQGVLGDFHDAIVAEGWLRAAAVDGSASVALVAGQLVAGQRQDAERGRAGWPDSWKRLQDKKLRAWPPK